MIVVKGLLQRDCCQGIVAGSQGSIGCGGIVLQTPLSLYWQAAMEGVYKGKIYSNRALIYAPFFCHPHPYFGQVKTKHVSLLKYNIFFVNVFMLNEKILFYQFKSLIFVEIAN